VTASPDVTNGTSQEEEASVGRPVVVVNLAPDDENKDLEKTATTKTGLLKSLPYGEQTLAVVLYILSSTIITFANKVVMTSYGMESFVFLSFAQSAFAVVALQAICTFTRLKLPKEPWTTFKQLHPLSFIFVVNAVFSLGGTQKLSIPMMTVLRRFSIAMTMVCEYWVLGIKSSPRVTFTVALMILGAIIAAADDLVFSMSGYTYVMISNVFTALYGVYNKKKLDECREIGMHGILYINNCLNVLIMFGIAVGTGDLAKVVALPHWTNPIFIFWFFMASALGLGLNFSMLYCTNVSSALTTAVIGCFKNIAVTYLGMVLVPGYAYTALNFAGINISIGASVLYSIVQRMERPASSK